MVSPDDLIRSMDDARISQSFVIANVINNIGYGLSTEQLLTLCEGQSRLKILGSIDFGDFNDVHVEMLMKLLKSKKIYGVKIYPGYQNYFPTDEKLMQLYSFCEKEGYPVMFHTGILANYQTGSGYLEQAQPLQIDKLATMFPNLKIVMAHMGNPWLIDCAAVLFRHENVYTDLSGFFNEFQPIKQRNRDELVESTYIIKNFLGSYEKFIFGTDFPLYSQKEYVEAVEAIPMSEKEKELVFYKNAQKIFQIESE